MALCTLFKLRPPYGSLHTVQIMTIIWLSAHSSNYDHQMALYTKFKIRPPDGSLHKVQITTTRWLSTQSSNYDHQMTLEFCVAMATRPETVTWPWLVHVLIHPELISAMLQDCHSAWVNTSAADPSPVLGYEKGTLHCFHLSSSMIKRGMQISEWLIIIL